MIFYRTDRTAVRLVELIECSDPHQWRSCIWNDLPLSLQMQHELFGRELHAGCHVIGVCELCFFPGLSRDEDCTSFLVRGKIKCGGLGFAAVW